MNKIIYLINLFKIVVIKASWFLNTVLKIVEFFLDFNIWLLGPEHYYWQQNVFSLGQIQIIFSSNLSNRIEIKRLSAFFILSVIGLSDKARPGSAFGVKFKAEDVNFFPFEWIIEHTCRALYYQTLLFNNDEEIRLGQGQTKIHGEVKKFQLPCENAVVLYVWV